MSTVSSGAKWLFYIVVAIILYLILKDWIPKKGGGGLGDTTTDPLDWDVVGEEPQEQLSMSKQELTVRTGAVMQALKNDNEFERLVAVWNAIKGLTPADIRWVAWKFGVVKVEHWSGDIDGNFQDHMSWLVGASLQDAFTPYVHDLKTTIKKIVESGGFKL